MLDHILLQAFLREKIKSKRLDGFFYNYGEINYNFSFYFLSKSVFEEIHLDLKLA